MANSYGGVELLSKVKRCSSGKKWWWCLFKHMMVTALLNAWRIHTLDTEQKIDQLSFIRTVARH
nr:unnamed protein product [Callosobruchus analis]